jgi:hypothetical protein
MKRLVGLLFLIALVATATADDWHIETVDSAGDVGRYTSLALDSSGYPHISYYYKTNKELKYAAWNGSSWDIETVDSFHRVGKHNSLALDSSGYPHISYNGNSVLKYAYWNGSSWDIETVDSASSVGGYTSLALDSAGNPRISYYKYGSNGDLRYAAWNGSNWVIEIVDAAGDVGRHTSLALDSAGNPRISYFDNTNYDLKYATWNGLSWDIETVDSVGSDGGYTSLALDSSGNPHISYYDDTNYDLKYAAWNGSSWDIETVDSYGNVGQYTSLALDSAGNPHISYFDYGSLNYAAWNGSSWDIETVDSAGWVGWYTSLALDSVGNPHISYYDGTNYDLKFATTRPDWDIEEVELTASPEDDGILLGWTVEGDVPASVRILRGEENPVAVSGSLDGSTVRWLDRDVEPGGSYVYWLEATDADGHTKRYGPTEAVVVPEQAQRLVLDEPWPNPADNSVSVAFSLPEAQRVSLSVYDLAGRRVATLSEGELPAGRHAVSWDCAGEASGVYLLRLETAGEALSRRVVVGR